MKNLNLTLDKARQSTVVLFWFISVLMDLLYRAIVFLFSGYLYSLDGSSNAQLQISSENLHFHYTRVCFKVF